MFPPNWREQMVAHFFALFLQRKAEEISAGMLYEPRHLAAGESNPTPGYVGAHRER